jgi:mRNA-degrading endonuclease toxin of MazEF toxin-antitoxin module
VARAAPPIHYGRLIYTWIKDRNGHGKLRPAVIITPDDEIAGSTPLVVMAVTTTFADPPPAACVALPWHPKGHPVTRLRQRSAAVVDWLARIERRDISGFGGDVPRTTMYQIEAKLRSM